MDTGNVLIHELAHTGGLGNDDAHLDGLAKLLGGLHELDELLRLKHGLGLEKLGAGLDLALHLHQLRVHGVGAGRHDSALGKLGGLANQVVAAQILAGFQQAGGMQQRHGIQIEHGLGLGMVAQLGVVAGEAEDVVDPQHGGAEQVGFQSNTVPIAAGQLENGVQSGILQHLAGGEGTEAHDGGLVVSNVDKMDAGEVLLRFLYHAVNMNSFGRADLGRNHKLTVVKQFSNSHNSIHS